MNAQTDHQETAAYNPFPEPQTIPSGWDTSAFDATPAADSANEADASAES